MVSNNLRMLSLGHITQMLFLKKRYRFCFAITIILALPSNGWQSRSGDKTSSPPGTRWNDIEATVWTSRSKK